MDGVTVRGAEMVKGKNSNNTTAMTALVIRASINQGTSKMFN